MYSIRSYYELEAAESGLSLLQVPTEITVMQTYGYILPVLVANRHRVPQSLRVETPWRQFEYPLPALSTRGFCLVITSYSIHYTKLYEDSIESESTEY